MFVESLEPRSLFSAVFPDANGDRVCDTQDFVILATNFNVTTTLISKGNFNGDAKVNSLDFSILAANFGRNLQMSTFNWLGTVDGNLGNHLNYLGSPAGVPGAGDILVIDAGAVGYSNQPQSNSGTPVTSLTTLSIPDGAAGDYTFMSTIAVTGNVTIANIATITLASVGGNISGSGGGDLTVTTKTGNGSLNYGGSLIITNLGTAQVTVGANQNTDLNFNGASVGAKVTFTSTSQSGTPFVTSFGNVYHGEMVANTIEGVNCNGSQFPANVVITGISGTFVNYTIASGSSYATQLSGTKTVGSTVTGTYTLAAGFSPSSIRDDNGHDLNDSLGTNVVIGGGSFSFVVSQTAVNNGFHFASLSLTDDANTINLGIGGFTAVSSAKSSTSKLQSRLRL